MISTPGARGPYQGHTPFHPAPNAALLIDFDNVTMGIRSDLGKELKLLLNSEVIRGKVAVQRAYADWRRYPQYIVPLAESSIDLIFAPAYGSAKKNATDLRMAIDAIELVFTRPEIGTYILMTGDSDFSSCVLKLKEYGKYVIGVGMRESSSDLLIQNCDEYYSYHSLSGLTRAGEVIESKEDPWVLVRRAAQQMAANGDVMRTDRLKQVMLDLDPAFDEKKLGYSKFSRFVQEAATKGHLRLRKTENGQFEIVVDDAPEARGEAAPAAAERPRRGRGRDEGRREGRRDGRPPRPEPQAVEAADEPRREEAASAAPVAEEAPREAPAAPATAPAEVPVAEAPAAAETVPVEGIDQAYAVLQEAVRALAGGGRSVRDGDVKRRMLEISPGFDESDLGFSKFTRFLRQAHDSEVIDLQRANGGSYEVSLPASGKRLPSPTSRPAAAAPRPETGRAPAAASPAAEAPARPAVAAETSAAPAASTPAAASGVGAVRGRRGRSAPLEGPPPLLPGQVVQVSRPAADTPAAAAPAPTAEAPAAQPSEAAEDETKPKKSRRGRRGRGGKGRAEGAAAEGSVEAAPAESAPEAVEEVAAVAEQAAAPEPAAPRVDESAGRPGRSRRGRRGPGADGPPPILPGQAVSAPAAAAPVEPAASAPGPDAPVAEAKPRRGRGRKTAAKTVAAAPPAGFSAARLGLPEGREAVETYLTSAYRGVGKKTAEALLDAFGDRVFETLQEEPNRVREQLGDRRAGTILEQWGADFERRNADVGGAEPAPDASAAPEAGEAAEDAAKPRSRSRRGGRGRSRKKKDAPTAG